MISLFSRHDLLGGPSMPVVVRLSESPSGMSFLSTDIPWMFSSSLQEALVRSTGRRADVIQRMQLVEKTGNTFKQFDVAWTAKKSFLSAAKLLF